MSTSSPSHNGTDWADSSSLRAGKPMFGAGASVWWFGQSEILARVFVSDVKRFVGLFRRTNSQVTYLAGKTQVLGDALHQFSPLRQWNAAKCPAKYAFDV